MTNNSRREFISRFLKVLSSLSLFFFFGCGDRSSILAPEVVEVVGASKAPTPRTPPEDKTVVGVLKKKCPLKTNYKTFKNWESGKDALFLESFGSSEPSKIMYYVDGVECIVAMNFTSFDPSKQKLFIKIEKNDGSWQEVWSWPPRKEILHS